MTRDIRIGCAGWSLNAANRAYAPGEGSHLERYAALFNCVEINSSFYRSHQPKTYVRWAASVPANFRFAVKMPRAITHDARLIDCEPLVDRFIGEIEHLGKKCGPVLVQLAPSLIFDPATAAVFFAHLRGVFSGDVVCEPRHASWFTPTAEKLLVAHQVARVAADPAPHAGGDTPAGWRGLAYFRLHGSPVIYRSAYDDDALEAISERIAALPAKTQTWVIFDNTTFGHAFFNALRLRALIAV